MGFRFRRTIKVLPGVRINLGRRGVSTSIGPRGLSHTIGHGKTTTTVGVPGTGLSHTSVSATRSRGAESGGAIVAAILFLLWLLL